MMIRRMKYQMSQNITSCTSHATSIRNFIMREYWNQSIILPDKTKQQVIADTIYQIRAEAKQIELEAQLGFEQTKKEFEKLILE